MIDRVELMNVVQFTVPRSSVLSSTGSLITLTGSFPSSSGHISIGPNVIQYQTVSCTTAIVVVQPPVGPFIVQMQSDDTLMLVDTLQFFSPICFREYTALLTLLRSACTTQRAL